MALPLRGAGEKVAAWAVALGPEPPAFSLAHLPGSLFVPSSSVQLLAPAEKEEAGGRR